jgi:hypothetical protein
LTQTQTQQTTMTITAAADAMPQLLERVMDDLYACSVCASARSSPRAARRAGSWFNFLLSRDASTTPVVATAVPVCMSMYNVVASVYNVVAL